MKQPRILDLHEITVMAGRQGFPYPTVDGVPACPVCLVRPRRGEVAEGRVSRGPRGLQAQVL